MANAWAWRAWALVRGLFCWLGAVACVSAGFVLPLMLVGRLVFATIYTPQNDLSDIATGLWALLVAAIAGMMAGVLGAWIATLPALVLIDKSGVFNRLLRGRRRPVETSPDDDGDDFWSR